MKKPKRQILRGQPLLQALKAMAPNQHLKLMIVEKVFHISVKMALSTIRTSPYEGEFRHGRIFKIREVADQRKIVHDPLFRNGRACLQFVAISPKTVDLWDKINARANSIP